MPTAKTAMPIVPMVGIAACKSSVTSVTGTVIVIKPDPPTPAANSPIPAGDPGGPLGGPRRADADCELARAVAMCAADAGFLAGLVARRAAIVSSGKVATDSRRA
jgi:hypothetical protein